MRKSLIIMIVAAALIAPAASAHTPGAYWSKQLIEETLQSDGVEWADTGYEDVDAVLCKGFGNSMRKRPGAPKLYKHFYCAVRTTDVAGAEDAYVIQVHILGLERYTYEFVRRA